jgi:predicted lipid-binding transport protein (Tim44 family)
MDKRTPPPAPGTDSTTAGAAKPTDDAESPVAKPAGRAPRARASASTRAAQPRRASAGDVAPAHTPSAMEAYDVAEAASSAIEQKKVALQDIIAHAKVGDTASLAKTLEAIMTGSSPDDAQALRKALLGKENRRRRSRRPARTTNWPAAGATTTPTPIAT